MGLTLRTASAKLWLAAMAAGVCTIGSAMAEEFCPTVGTEIADPGTNTVAQATAYTINADSPDGYQFNPTGSIAVTVHNTTGVNAGAHNAIFFSPFPAVFSSVCYDGNSSAELTSTNGYGIFAETYGDTRLRSLGKIDAAIGISVTQSIDASPLIIEAGEIEASSDGILVTKGSDGPTGIAATKISAGRFGVNLNVQADWGDLSIVTGDIESDDHAIYSSQIGDGTTTVTTGNLTSYSTKAAYIYQDGDGAMTVQTGDIVAGGGSYYGLEIGHRGTAAINVDIGSFTGPAGGVIINRHHYLGTSTDYSGDGNIHFTIRGSVTAGNGDGVSIWQRNATTSDSDISLRVNGRVLASAWGVAVIHDGRAGLTQGNGDIDVRVNAVSAGIDAVHIEKNGNGNITTIANGAIASLNTSGISIAHTGSGNVIVETSDDVEGPDAAINVDHTGDGGNISITTATGKTLTATGGSGSLLIPGPAGIVATRMGGMGATGNIVIHNGSDIAADFAGIYAEICDCVVGNIDITSLGVIEVLGDPLIGSGIGISAMHYGTGDVSVDSSNNIEAPDVGIEAVSFSAIGDVLIETMAGSVIETSSGYGSTLTPYLGDTGLLAVRAAPLTGGAVATGTVSIRSAATIRATDVGIFAGDLDFADSLFLGPGPIPGPCTCTGNGNAIAVNLESSGDIIISGGFGIEAGILAITYGEANLRIANGTISAPVGVAVVASHAVVAVGKDATIFDVSGSGIGLLISTLTGADLIVGGVIDTQGGAAIIVAGQNNTLTLETGASIAGVVFADPSSISSKLILGGSHIDAFDLDLMDTQYIGFSHDLQKSGTSIWKLKDTSSSFMGSITADAGKLILAGDPPADFESADFDIYLRGTASLGGNGRFGMLTATSGILAPGNSIGTLTIGTVNVAGIVYQVETNAAGASDKVIVTGAATIDAATSSVLAMPEAGAYAKSTTYTILTAGTLNGGFGSVASASPLFLATLTQDSKNIYLTLTRNVAGAGVTPNQKATGTGLDSFSGAAPYFADLMALPSANIPAALSALSGDGYASLMTALITDQRYLRDAVLDRLTTARFTPEPIIVPGFASDLDLTGLETPRVWGRAYGGLAAIAGDGNGPAINRGSGGLIAGADADLGDIHAGVVASTGGSSFAIPDRNMIGTSGELSVGTYGDTEWDAFYLSLGATITGHAISTTRTASFGGVNDTYAAQYGALTSQGFGEIGYRIETGATTLAPFAGLALVNTTTAGFTETGTGPGALTVAASSVSAAITTLGVRLEHQFVLNDDMLVTVSGSAAWRHAFGGQGATSNAFAGGAPFTVLGAPLAADEILVTAGADIDISEDLALGLAYSGAFGSGGSHAVHATLSGHF